MPLSREAVEQFQRIYEEVFQEKLSFDAAKAMATDFLFAMRDIMRPSPQDLSTGETFDFMEAKRD